MKNIRIIKKGYPLVFLSIVILLAYGCDDFLDQPVMGSQTEDNFYKSPGAAYQSIVKCYTVFSDAYGYEFPRTDLGNIATDDSEKGGSDASDRPFVNDLAFGRSLPDNEDLSFMWEGYYKGIGDCNLVIENFPKNNLLDESGYPLKKEVEARYIAEAKFIRAYLYFDLVRVFGGLPIIDKTLPTNIASTLKRAPTKEVFEFIESQLNEIDKDNALPSARSLDPSELGRITQEAVWAVQARLYMFFAKDDNSLFTKAKEAALRIINTNFFQLENNYQDLFTYGNYNSRESILTFIRGDNPSLNVYGSFTPLYSSPRGPTGAWGFDCPTQDLVDEFEDGDPRLMFTVVQSGDVFEGEELDFSSYPNTGYHNRKTYLPPSKRGAGWGDNAWSFITIRYADILLLYAEALFESGGDVNEVVKYINMVRERARNSSKVDKEASLRNLYIADNIIPDVKSTDDLRHAIRHERRVEFALEYQRLYDLLRWETYIDKMNSFLISSGKTASLSKGKNELFPVPQVEIDRTEGSITQNPGY